MPLHHPMYLWISLVIAGSSMTTSQSEVDDGKRVVCYYRWNHGGLSPEKLPVGCTHILVSFVRIAADSKLNLSQVGDAEQLKEFVELYHRIQPRTKLLICVGGSGSQDDFPPIIESRKHRRTFLEATSDLLLATGLDGIDYDWEFPQHKHRSALADLLQETSESLQILGNRTRKHYEVGIALPGPFTLASGFPVSSINRYCTFASVMSYDLLLYDGVFVRRATLHSALNPQVFLLHPFRLFSVRQSMTWWNGIDPKKLNLGIPTYSVAYELCNANVTHLLACIKGFSPLGANLNYAEVCRMRKEFPANEVWNDRAGAPYIFDDKGNWVTFDNELTISRKVDYALAEGYGGLMVFTLNADDTRGSCGQPFPLLRTAVARWNGQRSPE